VSILPVASSSNTERDIRGRLGLHFQPNRMEWVIPPEQVARAFSEILQRCDSASSAAQRGQAGRQRQHAETIGNIQGINADLPGGRDRLRQRHGGVQVC
jgi:hypothetical protein